MKILGKFEKKVQDIKCSFCVITKVNMLYLKSLVENLKRGEPFVVDEHNVERLKEEAGMIVHLLLFGNVETDKWLWTYYLKTVAISRYNDNERFIGENPFEDDQLETAVSAFIEHCKADNYLPPAKTAVDLVSKNPKIYKNMFVDLRSSGLFLGILMDRDFFSTDFLYLRPFWHDDRLLFGQITGARVDWGKAKRRFDLEVAETREFVKNRTWIYKPYGRLDHQRLLVNIIDARILCHVSVVLDLYEKQLSTLDQRALTRVTKLIHDVLLEVLKYMSFKDDFLLNILSELKYAQVSEVDDIKDISARVRARADSSLNDLNGTRKSGIDWFDFDVDRRQLSTDDLIMTILKELDDYLNDLANFVRFEYKVLLHMIGVAKGKKLS